MADGKRRINIVIHPDGTITAGTEGLYGGECLPYMSLIFNALDAVPNVPAEQAYTILTDDYYNHLPRREQQEENRQNREQNYVYR